MQGADVKATEHSRRQTSRLFPISSIRGPGYYYYNIPTYSNQPKYFLEKGLTFELGRLYTMTAYRQMVGIVNKMLIPK